MTRKLSTATDQTKIVQHTFYFRQLHYKVEDMQYEAQSAICRKTQTSL